MKKGSFALVMSLVFFTLCSSAMCADNPKRWKVGHLRQSGSAIDKDLHLFIEQIAKKTDNKFLFDVYSGNKLGD